MQENFTYSLMASGLGILIVFAILLLLSVMMIVIRKISDSDSSNPVKALSGKTASAKSSSSEIPLPVLVSVAAAATADTALRPDWIAAATAAFLAAEDDEAVIPSAVNWAAGLSNTYDPWVSNNKLSKSAPGA